MNWDEVPDIWEYRGARNGVTTANRVAGIVTVIWRTTETTIAAIAQ